MFAPTSRKRAVAPRSRVAFGKLYEINSSGVDFDSGSAQGNNDPEHTLVNLNGVGGFALVDLDEGGRTAS